MQKLRQVLRFYSQGKGTKTISSIVGISRNTVKKYLQIFHTLHMDFEDVVGLEDSRLGELFSLTPNRSSTTHAILSWSHFCRPTANVCVIKA